MRTLAASLALALLPQRCGCAAVGSEEACSLNGVVLLSSGSSVDGGPAATCRCDDGWRGPRCSQLDLVPADRRTPGYYNASMPTWYGSVVEERGQFHMFAVARAVPEGPPLDDYFTNSKLVRLASTTSSAAGPYVLEETVLPRFAHEARATRAPDGMVVIFGVTGTDGGIPLIPTTKCGLLRNASFPWSKLALTLSWAPSVRGPWQHKTLWQFHEGTASSPFCRMEAPVITFAPNGSVILIFNAFPCAPTPWRPSIDQLYLATAAHWSGPYHRRAEPIVRRPGFAGGTEGAEDPFIWRTSRGYHLLLHALGRAPAPSSPGGSTQGAGGLAYSKNGLDWTWVNGSDSPLGAVYSPNVGWSDKTTTRLTRRQAPYLYFDSSGALQFLLNGVDMAAGEGCHWRTAWTLLQPIRRQEPAAGDS